MLPADLCGCETWAVAVVEECVMFKNKALKQMLQIEIDQQTSSRLTRNFFLYATLIL